MGFVVDKVAVREDSYSYNKTN